MKTAEDIVRALAESEYLADDVANCFHCGGSARTGSPEHEPECSYRMAQEWVAEMDARQRSAQLDHESNQAKAIAALPEHLRATARALPLPPLRGL